MKTVLLVEDEETDALIFRYTCKKAGVTFSLQTVRDGCYAIDYLSGAGIYADRTAYPIPSLIILDLNMPAMSGFDVIKWIRTSSEHKDLYIVVFSSSYFEKDIKLAYDLGANSYVTKPCNSKELLGIVSMFERFWLHPSRN